MTHHYARASLYALIRSGSGARQALVLRRRQRLSARVGLKTPIETIPKLMLSYPQNRGVSVSSVSPASALCPKCDTALPDVIVPQSCPNCAEPVNSDRLPLVTVGKDATPVKV